MASQFTESPAEHTALGKDSDDHKLKDEFSAQSTTSSGNLAENLEPHESYEGKYRWDPGATWDRAEETTLVRKTDLYLLTWICVMFFGLQLGEQSRQAF